MLTSQAGGPGPLTPDRPHWDSRLHRMYASMQISGFEAVAKGAAYKPCRLGPGSDDMQQGYPLTLRKPGLSTWIYKIT